MMHIRFSLITRTRVLAGYIAYLKGEAAVLIWAVSC